MKKFNFMKIIHCTTFGLDKEIYDQLSSSARNKYNTKLLALLITIVMSVFIPIEVTQLFFEDVPIWVLFTAIFIWSSLLTLQDVLIFRNSSKSSAIPRALFSLGIAIFASACFFISLTKKDIQNQMADEASNNARVIDSTYYAQRDARFSEVQELKKEQKAYHKLCEAEALIGYAGEKYEKKHQHCENLFDKIDKLKSELNDEEIVFKDAYLEKKSKAQQVPTLGLYELVGKVFDFIKADNLRIAMFFLILIIVFMLESNVLVQALTGNNDEYDHLKELKEAELAEINQKKINIWKSDKVSDVENQSNFDNLNRKLEALLNFQFIKKQYDSAKSQEPDLFTNVDSSIEQLLSSEIANYGNEIEDLIEDQLRNEKRSEDFKDTTENKDAKAEVKNNFKNTNVKNEKPEELNSYYYSLYYCTQPMKALADEIWGLANEDEFKFCKELFNWCLKNIVYTSHNNQHYKTARETFNSRSGVCGEMAILFIAILRYKRISADYLHVDIDSSGKSVIHACAGVNLKGKYHLVDIAYKNFNAPHQKWNKVDDNQLIENMKGWNR